MRVISLIGRPTEVKTITMVTRPALGTEAAPMAARVAVMLELKKANKYTNYALVRGVAHDRKLDCHV